MSESAKWAVVATIIIIFMLVLLILIGNSQTLKQHTLRDQIRAENGLKGPLIGQCVISEVDGAITMSCNLKRSVLNGTE